MNDDYYDTGPTIDCLLRTPNVTIRAMVIDKLRKRMENRVAYFSDENIDKLMEVEKQMFKFGCKTQGEFLKQLRIEITSKRNN